MICTKVFRFMKQDDMRSDSMSPLPTATPSKVLPPFSSASVVQILSQRETVKGALSEKRKVACVSSVKKQRGSIC